MDNELIQKAIEWAETAEAFVKSEMPIFVKEVLHYYSISHTVLMIAFITFIIISCYGVYRTYKWSKKGSGYEAREVSFEFAAYIRGALALGAIIGVIYHALMLVKIVVAPRLYLIELFL